MEVSNTRVKFAAGAYIGTLEAPEQMAVFLYYLNVNDAGRARQTMVQQQLAAKPRLQPH